jgi:hypothetical protein
MLRPVTSREEVKHAAAVELGDLTGTGVLLRMELARCARSGSPDRPKKDRWNLIDGEPINPWMREEDFDAGP